VASESVESRTGLTGAERSVTISIETMTKVEQIEHEVQSLTGDELGDFRSWFAEFDARVWDRQFEDDVQSGKLDAVADRARRFFEVGFQNRSKRT